jgi:hypothetical protein
MLRQLLSCQLLLHRKLWLQVHLPQLLLLVLWIQTVVRRVCQLLFQLLCQPLLLTLQWVLREVQRMWRLR